MLNFIEKNGTLMIPLSVSINYFSHSFTKRLCYSILLINAFSHLQGIQLLLFRLWIMGWSSPKFSKSDNPAHHEKEWKTR